jgi:hypothetical protein
VHGSLIKFTDARGNLTQFGYEYMDRPNSRTDALLRAESRIYDKNGNVTSWSSPRAQRTRSAIGGRQGAHAHEGAHDLDVYRDGACAAQYRREHGHALLGEGIWGTQSWTTRLEVRTMLRRCL